MPILAIFKLKNSVDDVFKYFFAENDLSPRMTNIITYCTCLYYWGFIGIKKKNTSC